ncbi:MAG TPA: YhbY family RNA-binding protein [Firmicutes bacterium]|nr:YhbY family RNA-binding protein [Bacillota bacterium]
MLTSKQRARLRALANPLETIMQVGKSGVTPELAASVGDALTARELIKLRALETCPTSPRETAQQLAQAAGAEVVQVIGTRFVLYRANPEKPVIRLD